MQLFVLQKWVSSIQTVLSDRVKMSGLINEKLISFSRAKLRAFSTIHQIAR